MERLVDVELQTFRDREAKIIKDVRDEIDRTRIKPTLEQQALAAINEARAQTGQEQLDLAAAKQLGKAWGQAYGPIAKDQNREVELTLPGEASPRRVRVKDAREAWQTALTGPETTAAVDLAKVRRERSAAEATIRQRARDAVRQLSEAKLDPALERALDAWGQSPNAANSVGDDGKGFNAGLVHWLEYRSDSVKNGRYALKHRDFGLQQFVYYTAELVRNIASRNPAINPSVAASAVLEDDQGNRRLLLVTNESRGNNAPRGDLIIAYKRRDEDRFRIITVIPGQTAESVKEGVAKELAGTSNGKQRLNALGSGVRLVEDDGIAVSR